MIFIFKCAYNLTLSALTYENAALHFQKKVKEKEDEEEHNEKGNSWGALTTKGAGIMAPPASVTLLPCSQFTSEYRMKAQNSEEKTSVYRLASFLKHWYSTLPDMCLCVLLHVFCVSYFMFPLTVGMCVAISLLGWFCTGLKQSTRQWPGMLVACS